MVNSRSDLSLIDLTIPQGNSKGVGTLVHALVGEVDPLAPDPPLNVLSHHVREVADFFNAYRRSGGFSEGYKEEKRHLCGARSYA
ncbi:conserved hypothetical protein [Ricinus communis]|uniref:Uncharacterized protein n=1 Tax=Ricinus communis TaxID=3988 RepID=B9SNK5_RICCO|nr:conserved hypothetical protein [Ricinus communis]